MSYKAKNDNLLIKVEDNKNKFSGQTAKPWYRAEVISVGELVKGTYAPGETVLVTPHATSLIIDDLYVVRETGVMVNEE